MFTRGAGSWDGVRQTFADQFEQKGATFVYRRSQKGQAVSVSAEEHQRFIDEFDRNLRRAQWIIYSGVTVAFGGIIGFSLLEGFDLSRPALFAGIGLVMVPYLAYYRWAWRAPARELAGRTPVAGERSPEEVRRLRFERMTYSQLGGAAIGGLAIPFIGARQDVFSGWNRLWLVFGAGLVLLAAVQAFRKWEFEREDSYRTIVPRPSNVAPASAQDSTTPGNSGLWRYVPFAAILLGLAFIAYTPAGKQLATQPSFWPIVLIGIGGWCLFTAVQGFVKGQVQPLTRGFYNSYQRETQPKRFWASLTWNVVWGCLFVWFAFQTSRDAGIRPIEDRCYNEGDRFPSKDALSACTRLIAGNESGTYLGRADMLLDRGLAYDDLNDSRRAIADYTEALRLEPDYPEAYLDRGFAYANLGNVDQALEDYAGAIRLRPSYAQAYLNRGLIFLDAGKLDSAIADFTHAHAFDPKNQWPLADRGMAYASQKDPVHAEQDFQAVRAINPSNAVLLRGEALLSMNAGDMRSAVAEFTDALYQDPGNIWSLQMRAEAYRQLGESDKSQADIQKARELTENASR